MINCGSFLFQKLFHQFDVDKSGMLSSFDLRRCVAAAGKILRSAHFRIHQLIWASSWENLFMPYRNNKGADQPAHLRSLISTFVVCCLDSIISSFYIWYFKPLASLCSWAGQFVSYLVTSPEDRFSCDGAHLHLYEWWTHEFITCQKRTILFVI